MTQLLLHRAHVMRPFTNYLRRLGAPVEREMIRSRLPLASLDDPQRFVASHAFWDFGYAMARLEGIESLGLLAAEEAGANLVAPDLREKLDRSLSLYQGISLVQETLSTEASGTRLKYTHTDNNSLRIFYTISFGPEHNSYDTFNLFCLAGLLEIIRVFCGPDWRPKETGLRLSHLPARLLLERLPDTQIVNAKHNYVDVEATAISSPAFRRGDSEASSVATPENIEPDLRDAIRKLLAGYSSQHFPDIKMTAEFSGMSVRTLQRRLSVSDSSYRDLVGEAKYEKASHLLLHTSEPLADIAYQLGYGNPTHFSRSFMRVAGVSPSVFRRQHQSNQHQ
jgi:AraC-like DNA-binding protein